MKDELAEILTDPKAATVIEWGGLVEEVLPPKRLTIRIKTLDKNRRELTISYPPNLSYLLPAKTSENAC